MPELAGRAHVATIGPVVRQALLEAGLDPLDPAILGIAVTSGPGLIGSLLVGLSAAKAYALAWGVPFVGVNHLEGHLFAPLLENAELEWPLMTLLVSGGHSLIVLQSGPGEHVVLGETIDDAAGEAYDKVARWLGLGYPGGPEIDHLAQSGVAGSLKLPQSMTGDGYDLSFSGLKTAVVRATEKQHDLAGRRRRGLLSGRGRRAVTAQAPPRTRAPPREGTRARRRRRGELGPSRRRQRTRQGVRSRGAPADDGDVHRQRRDDRGRRDVPTSSRRRESVGPLGDAELAVGGRLVSEMWIPLEIVGLRSESVRAVPTLVRRGEG